VRPITHQNAGATNTFVARWCLVGLCLAACFAAYISLLPFRFERSTVALTLETLLSRAEFQVISLTDFGANVLLFVPIGFFGAGALARQSFGWYATLRNCGILVASAVFSFTIEALQVLVPSRIPSLADVGAQLIGTTAGLLAWSVIAFRLHIWVRSARPNRT
jgi:glycopeptide antibiotics resistance protein